jgi:hypothetical protein
MATVDLSTTRDRDGFVFYFGGEPNEVDTYTFANALLALSDAFREINAQVNPGFSLELRLEAVAEGSFKARLKEKPKDVKGAMKFGVHDIVMPIFVAFVYTHIIDPQKTNVIVNDDEVIIEQSNGDRVVVPRKAYNSATKLPDKDKVAAHVARSIAAVDEDPNVTSLGLLKFFDDETPPALLIDRADFATIRQKVASEGGNKRKITEEATLTILKVVMARTARKWDFVWNGVKISAAIRDPAFMADLLSRKYLIGSGDGLRVILEIEQERDEVANVWLNTGYSVQKVERFISAGASTAPLDFGGDA